MHRLLLALAATIALSAPAFADNWGGLGNIARNAAQNYLNANYAAELQGHNVQLTKSEFGGSTLAAIGHVALDVIIDGVFGGTLVYNPATAEIVLWKATGSKSEAKEAATVNPYTSGCNFTYGFVTELGWCIPGSSIGTASTNIVPVVVGTIPAVNESCTWDPKSDGIDTHTC